MEYDGEAFPPVLGTVTYEGGYYDQYQEEEEWWPEESEGWSNKSLAAVTRGKGNTDEDQERKGEKEEENEEFTEVKG